MALRFDRRSFFWFCATLGLAALGGLIFSQLDLPAAWLMGAMVAVAIAALIDLPVGLPTAPREVAFLLLGTSMGSSVTPEIVAQISRWPGAIAMLAGSIAATILVSSSYLQRVHGWDRMTARFASMPGAFSSVAIIASNSDADLPRVILAQSLRVFALVALMPPILTFANGGVPVGAAQLVEKVNTGGEMAIVFLAGAALAIVLRRLNVPASTLLAAMTASAALHATGVVNGRLPPPLVMLGLVATGAVIGARFRGTTWQTVVRTVPAASVSILLALLVAAFFAWSASRLLGLPFGQLWLAYAPGGVEAMAAMALVLNLEPAFVGTHHILRILGLNLISPFWLRNRRGKDGGSKGRRD